jgi:ZIP family zinc transporter
MTTIRVFQEDVADADPRTRRIGTALATGLGAIPVFMLGERAEELRPFLLGLAAGVMAVASIVGLLLPGIDEGSLGAVAAGCAVGVVFLLATRRFLRSHEPHFGRLRGASVRTSVLVFAVLFAHSVPEGFAIGTAYASDTEGLSLFVILAIALQNIPEGTSVAVPMQRAGFSAAQQFWAAVGTSAPQPIGAVIAYLAVEQVTGLLPVSFGFAAGAMLALVLVEVLPDAVRTGRWWRASAGVAAGAAVMMALSLALGVE